MSLQFEMDKRLDLVNNRLEALLQIKYPETIYKAMHYSVMSGGKRIRPLLLLGTFEAVAGEINEEEQKTVLDFACALEMIHSYSLIHDDLPALDNDDYRRGRLTNHKVHGEAIAILAGDALLNMAYETMINKSSTSNTFSAIGAISTASGVCGMIGGQVVDILLEGKNVSWEEINYIHMHKTAAIIKSAIISGAILGNASMQTQELLGDAGEKLGMAFQIKDDILDITSTQEVLGKPINSDARNKKTTYVSVKGMTQAVKDCQKLSEEALTLIEKAVGKTDKALFLFELAQSMMNRTK